MMLPMEEAKAPPPTPENMAAMTMRMAGTSADERAIAVQMHGMARRIEVK